MRLNFLCRKLSWLWSGSHTSRLAPAHRRYHRPPCLQGPRARDCFPYHLLESPVLQADTRPTERITSHDSHSPIRVSDCSVVFGYCSCSLLCADLLNRFIHYFVGSLWWFPTSSSDPIRQVSGVNSIFCPVLGSKLKPCLCGPKQTHRPQSVFPVTAIKFRRQLTFSALDGHWLYCSI